MSSFITNFRDFSERLNKPKPTLFLSLFLAAFGMMSGIFGYLVLTLEPYTGDLTRIGGLLEKDFGWNGTQKRFSKPLYKKGETIEDYDRYFDIVVIGDSFSNQGPFGWQNYLQQLTGYSILSFHFDDVSLDHLLESETFRNLPPALVIYQVVEHGMHDRFIGYEKRNIPTDHETGQVTPALPPKREVAPAVVEEFTRTRSPKSHIDAASHYLKMRLRQLTGSRQRVYIRDLSRRDLFSNRKPDKCLLYYADFIKNRISDEEWAAVEKRYFVRQKTFEQESKTRLLFMIVPDRTTAFLNYLRPIEGDNYRPAFERMPGKYSFKQAPILDSIRAAISEGTKDVYLPNDAHWGSAGHRIAAEALASYLKNLSVRELSSSETHRRADSMAAD